MKSFHNQPTKDIAQVEVPYNLRELKREQASVDEGHSPWKLDPIFVAQVFSSVLISPNGIIGDYPIAYDEITLICKDSKKAIVAITNNKSIAKKVYLNRLVRCNNTGIWTVIGYDTSS